MNNSLFTTYLNSILFMAGAQLDLAKERLEHLTYIEFYLPSFFTEGETKEVIDKIELLLSSPDIIVKKVEWREEPCYQVEFRSLSPLEVK